MQVRSTTAVHNDCQPLSQHYLASSESLQWMRWQADTCRYAGHAELVFWPPYLFSA